MALVIFVLSLLIRLPDLEKFATIDESRWIQRGADFWTSLRKGDAPGTFLIGHPGVTTMWLVGLGMGSERVERMATRPGLEDVTRREGYLDALVSARRSFVLLAAGLLALITLLTWRLAGAGPGTVAGLLLATDPFLAAHAQLAHLDATLTAFMAIAVLSAMVFGLRGGSLGYLAVSGVATGLALLTKAPSIILLPAIPLITTLPRLTDLRLFSKHRLQVTAVGLLVWGLLAVAAVVLLWPAFRMDPLGTLQKLVQFTARVGGGEHDNFFMSQATDDPGALYYPTMVVFRLGLGTLSGMLLLTVLRRSPEWRGLIVASVLFVLGFMLMMNLGPKKFDRYMLPIFPILGIWAALGWWSLATHLPVNAPRATVLVVVAVLLQLVPTLLVRPYYLSYFNPLLGGGAAAQRQVLVGWGEDMAPVAAYLNAKPIVIGAPTVASSYHRVLQAHLDGSALPIERIDFADYVVPYVNTLQRGLENDILGLYLQSQAPELSVWHNGIEYARVYRGPHYPVTLPVGAALSGSTLVESVIAPGSLIARPGDSVDVLLRWRAASAAAPVAVRLQASDGRAIASVNRRLGEDGQGGNRGGAEDQVADLHTLEIPRNAPPGTYALSVAYGDAEAGLAELRVEAQVGR